MIDELYAWAYRHNIPSNAVGELEAMLIASAMPTPTLGKYGTEAGTQQQLRFAAAKQGWLMWRNNSGVGLDETGQRTNRYGLCNDSPKINEKFKSSDLIGIKPLLITPDMVGTIVGQFAAREVKRAGWKYTGADRERAQLAFLELVNLRGGDGKFSTGEL